MVGHGGSSAGSYLADPTSPIPSHCASTVVTSTLRVNKFTVLHELIVAPLCGRQKKPSNDALCSAVNMAVVDVCSRDVMHRLWCVLHKQISSSS